MGDDGRLIYPNLPPAPSHPRPVEADDDLDCVRLVLQTTDGYQFGCYGLERPFTDPDTGELAVRYVTEMTLFEHYDKATRGFRPFPADRVAAFPARCAYIERPTCGFPDCQRASGPDRLCAAHAEQRQHGVPMHPV